MLCDGWFLQRGSMEQIKQGSMNEDSGREALREISIVERIYDIGLMTDKDRGGPTCSTDGIVLLSLSKWTMPSDWQSQRYGKEETGKYTLCVNWK